MEINGDQTTNLTRFTVQEAADALGLSAEAVRMRIKRGTLAHVKEKNTVYVLLDSSSLDTGPKTPSNPKLTQPDNDQTALIAELRDRVRYLEEEARRRDIILMNMTETMKAITAASEPREAPETASNDPGKENTAKDVQRPPEPRSLLRRGVAFIRSKSPL
jgi:hypothetical protein